MCHGTHVFFKPVVPHVATRSLPKSGTIALFLRTTEQLVGACVSVIQQEVIQQGSGGGQGETVFHTQLLYQRSQDIELFGQGE